MLDAKDEENSVGMCNIDHEAASPYTIYTAALPKPSLIDSNINLIAKQKSDDQIWMNGKEIFKIDGLSVNSDFLD